MSFLSSFKSKSKSVPPSTSQSSPSQHSDPNPSNPSRRGFLKGMVATALGGAALSSNSSKPSDPNYINKAVNAKHSISKAFSSANKTSNFLDRFKNSTASNIKNKIDSVTNKVEPVRNFLANSDKVQMSRRQFLKSSVTAPVKAHIVNTANSVANKINTANTIMSGDPSRYLLRKTSNVKPSRLGSRLGFENINDLVIYHLQDL